MMVLSQGQSFQPDVKVTKLVIFFENLRKKIDCNTGVAYNFIQLVNNTKSKRINICLCNTHEEPYGLDWV